MSIFHILNMEIMTKRSNKVQKITDWKTLSNEHHQKVDATLDYYVSLRSHGKKHAVLDFLFEYYSFRPGKIAAWNPGINLQINGDWNPTDKLYSLNNDDFWQLNPQDFPKKRLGALEWVIILLQNIENRPMAFGCFGLHEWAMVYKAPKVRHESHPLRLKPDEIATFLENQPIRCSHFDAFRFFTNDARPMNLLKPEYDSRLENEQGGCIHANMDLYKWAYKFHPWISSEMLSEAFLLAYETRQFDMKASPYDLSIYNLEPIKIETEVGREKYQSIQMEIAQKASEVRKKLLKSLIDILAWSKFS
jgi:hypothetical protein